jgi:hypothetical protein
MKKQLLLLTCFLLLLSSVTVAGNFSVNKSSLVHLKTASGYPGGYSLALWIGINKYYITFNEDLTYIGNVQEYYTGRYCDINSNSVTLVTDDDFSPIVNYSLSFNDYYYWGSYSYVPEVLTPSGNNTQLYYYGHS